MITLTDVQKVALSIQPVDIKGNPAPIDGVPVWRSSDETIITVTPTEDGLGATVFAVGPLGNAQITVEVDADLGDGVITIAGILDVTIIASQAVSVDIVPGVPEIQ